MSERRSAPPDTAPGQHDFDFLLGRWSVLNRKLRNPLDPDDSEWSEFTTYVENEQVLGGLGNVDKYRSDEFPGHQEWKAIALRLFDPERLIWRIWWASTASPGELDTPVVGAFRGGRGLFECDDVLGGRAVRVRFKWIVGGDQPVWRQSFSFDAGQSWSENWLMTWSRAS
jgi:hypothetical protein